MFISRGLVPQSTSPCTRNCGAVRDWHLEMRRPFPRSGTCSLLLCSSRGRLYEVAHDQQGKAPLFQEKMFPPWEPVLERPQQVLRPCLATGVTAVAAPAACIDAALLADTRTVPVAVRAKPAAGPLPFPTLADDHFARHRKAQHAPLAPARNATYGCVRHPM